MVATVAHTTLTLTRVGSVYLFGVGMLNRGVSNSSLNGAADDCICEPYPCPGAKVATLAAESASSLLGMLVCPGIHWITRRALTLLILRRSSSRAVEEPSKATQSDWLSVKIATEFSSVRLSSTQPIDIRMTLRSSSKEQVRAAPRAFSVIITVRAAGSPLVITTPAPPFVVQALAEPSE